MTQNQNTEQQLEQFNDVHLTHEEKAQLRQNLLSYMKANPTTQLQPRGPYHQREEWRILPFLVPLFLPIFSLPVSLSIAVFGFFYTAQASLPGEFFYWLKIFSENLTSFASYVPQERIRQEISCAGRRLKEAQRLLTESRLDNTITLIAAKNFASHIDTSLKLVKYLQAQGKIKEAADMIQLLGQCLDIHEPVVLRLLMANESVGMRGLLARFYAKRDIIASLGYEVIVWQDNDTTREAVKNIGQFTLRSLQGIDNTVQLAPGKLNEKVRIQLNDARALLAQGQERQSAGMYKDALFAFQGAYAHSQEASILLQELIASSGLQETPLSFDLS